MLPRLHINNCLNGISGYAIRRNQSFQRMVYRIVAPDLANSLRTDNAGTRAVSSGSALSQIAVSHIVNLRSCFKVIRIYAGRIIAGVSHDLIRLYFPVMDFITQSVGIDRYASLASQSVSVLVQCSVPRPASIPALLDAIPESFQVISLLVLIGAFARTVFCPSVPDLVRRAVKFLSAKFTSTYYGSSQSVNLRDRFAAWLGSLEWSNTLAGRFVF